jgi:hypothetical protein
MKLYLTGFFLLMAFGAIVGCSSRSPDEKMSWMSEKISNKLDLNEDQELKLKDLMAAFKEQKKAHADEEGKSQLKTMVLSEKLNHDALKGLFAKKQAKMNDSFEAVYPKLEAFHASLNPEQKKEVVEFFEKMSKKWNHH